MTPVSKKQHLPSPVTHQDSISSDEAFKDGTATPPEGRPSQIQHRPTEQTTVPEGLSSPPQDLPTQAFSQFIYPPNLSTDVKNEQEEGVWGYLHPLDPQYGKTLVLKKRSACPMPGANELGNTTKNKPGTGKETRLTDEEVAYENTKFKGIASGGYLIGRHPECGMFSKNERIQRKS
jgi:serine/threonine-protein kinase Chk2